MKVQRREVARAEDTPIYGDEKIRLEMCEIILSLQTRLTLTEQALAAAREYIDMLYKHRAKLSVTWQDVKQSHKAYTAAVARLEEMK